MMSEMFFLEENSFPTDPSFVSSIPPAPLRDMDGETRKEYWASLALRHCAGLGYRTQIRLLRKYGSAYAAMRRVSEWEKCGFSTRLAREILSDRWRKGAGEEWKQAGEVNASILLWNNALFPQRLRELPDCPILLYLAGDVDLLKSPCIGMVGSRGATERSCGIALSLAASLSACGITVVSGMAWGIDCHAHLGALEHVGKSIGVLGTGIDVDYPRANGQLFDAMRGEGLLLSEFTPKLPPISRNFPVRNRIISGLSLGVVVVEAAVKSGSLITARLALEQNREVFAVPGAALDSTSLGCQNLVRQGAHAVFNVDDILRNLTGELRQYGLKMPDEETVPVAAARQAPHRCCAGVKKEPSVKSAAPSPEMDAEGREVAEKMVRGEKSEMILGLLRKGGRMHVEEIARSLDISQQDLNASLIFMEMLGQVRLFPGSYFEAIS